MLLQTNHHRQLISSVEILIADKAGRIVKETLKFSLGLEEKGLSVCHFFLILHFEMKLYVGASEMVITLRFRSHPGVRSRGHKNQHFSTPFRLC